MLRDEIDTAKRIVSTDSVSISIGEVSNLYQGKELNIIPEFQRLFRWTNEKKTNFIESVLIGIPIPPVFVFEDRSLGLAGNNFLTTPIHRADMSASVSHILPI